MTMKFIMLLLAPYRDVPYSPKELAIHYGLLAFALGSLLVSIYLFVMYF